MEDQHYFGLAAWRVGGSRQTRQRLDRPHRDQINLNWTVFSCKHGHDVGLLSMTAKSNLQDLHFESYLQPCSQGRHTMLELRLARTMVPKAISESHPSAQEAASMEDKPIGSTRSAIVLCPKEIANAAT